MCQLSTVQIAKTSYSEFVFVLKNATSNVQEEKHQPWPKSSLLLVQLRAILSASYNTAKIIRGDKLLLIKVLLKC